LLTCEALTTTQEKFAFTVFERTFKEFGLPQAIRTDNGVPFASGHALYGLSTEWNARDGPILVRQRLLDNRTRVAIQHRNRLLARVQIAPDQSHLGLLQSEALASMDAAQSTRIDSRSTSL
jgi:hypothetical protein